MCEYILKLYTVLNCPSFYCKMCYFAPQYHSNVAFFFPVQNWLILTNTKCIVRVMVVVNTVYIYQNVYIVYNV